MDQLTRVKNPATNDGEGTRVVMADDRPASGRARERSGNPGMLGGRTMAPVDRLAHLGHLMLATLGRQPVIGIGVQVRPQFMRFDLPISGSRKGQNAFCRNLISLEFTDSLVGHTDALSQRGYRVITDLNCSFYRVHARIIEPIVTMCQELIVPQKPARMN